MPINQVNPNVNNIPGSASNFGFNLMQPMMNNLQQENLNPGGGGGFGASNYFNQNSLNIPNIQPQMQPDFRIPNNFNNPQGGMMNNSLPPSNVNMQNLGLGLMSNIGGFGDFGNIPQFQNSNISNNSYNPNDMNMNMGNPMFYNTMRNDPNFMNRFVQQSENNLNTQNEEEAKLRQEEDIQKMAEYEEEMRKVKDYMENYLKYNKNITYIKQDLFDIRRSEKFHERDRYFFEELIQKPLKASGLTGMGNIHIDKSGILINKKAKINFPKENDYFDKLNKDGIYLDYVKKEVYSFNIQKLEQRLIREVLNLNLIKL